MTLKTADDGMRRRLIWLIVGLLLLMYAVIGNWLVLPGYRRFLAHEAGGVRPDGLALIWGASRTILWMLSFHLGAFCVAWAAIRASGASLVFQRWFVAGGIGWIAVWTIPSLPGPYTSVFAGGGIVILMLIASAFTRAALTGEAFAGARGPHWILAAAFFFALATWDVCGLGSVGQILRPDSALRTANQSLVVTQTTKLLAELAIGWALIAAAAFPAPRRAT